MKIIKSEKEAGNNKKKNSGSKAKWFWFKKICMRQMVHEESGYGDTSSPRHSGNWGRTGGSLLQRLAWVIW
jgi:hypothetical protein